MAYNYFLTLTLIKKVDTQFLYDVLSPMNTKNLNVL